MENENCKPDKKNNKILSGKKVKENIMKYVCMAGFAVAVTVIIFTKYNAAIADRRISEQGKELADIKEQSIKEQERIDETAYVQEKQESNSNYAPENTDTINNIEDTGNALNTDSMSEENIVYDKPDILAEYKELYEINNDIIGWLFIADSVIDYPVMQTPDDEEYYLKYDFYGEKNKNGCLVLDTDSDAGTGTKASEYLNGTKPSTNLIIHGHTMKSGLMFGKLSLYEDEEYGLKHNIICFDTLYEKREYELIAVFYSQVYYQNEDVFKYYNFFQADNEEEFDYWYNNIMALRLYDTGVTAEYGDEFITLSCCAYHVEDGRFVVIGRRIN